MRARFEITEIILYKFESAMLLFSIKTLRQKYPNSMLKIYFHRFISDDEFLIDNVNGLVVSYKNKVLLLLIYT